MKSIRYIIMLLAITLSSLTVTQAQNPLPSWNDGAAKKSITEFVAKVTTPGSPDFVPVPERIATFDNDGTLWCEQPMYFQLIFAIDRVKTLVPSHPECKTKEPFASLRDLSFGCNRKNPCEICGRCLIGWARVEITSVRLSS